MRNIETTRRALIRARKDYERAARPAPYYSPYCHCAPCARLNSLRARVRRLRAKVRRANRFDPLL